MENPTQADSQNLALQVLAVHSGGLVFAQSGDLAGQITRCMADGQDYYEISFDAEAGEAAMQYRALQVKLGRAGTTARAPRSVLCGRFAVHLGRSSHGLDVVSVCNGTRSTHVLAAEARLVVVDVTALDKKGLPIKGLSTYFSLREDGVAQKIVSVEEHSTADHAIPAAPTDAAPDGTIVASNKPPAGAVWNVVLIDLYNTEKEDRQGCRASWSSF